MALIDNLAGYWKLDESTGSAADSTANANTLTNNGSITYVAWKINNGASSSATGWLYSTSNLWITSWSISISLWVKLNSEIWAGQYFFVSQWNNADNKVFYRIYYEYNWWTRRVVFGRDKNSVGEQKVITNITLWTTNWHHLVMTYDWTNIVWYIDTTASSPTAASGNGSGTARNEFVIWAYYNWAWSAPANAIMDEYWVWSRALSSTEVTSLNNGGNGIQYPFATTNIKSINWLWYASIKSINWLAIASIKNFNWLS